jgi:hypothetical protein
MGVGSVNALRGQCKEGIFFGAVENSLKMP